jgi:hypothetical protein
LARFKRSTLPEHKGTRIVVLRFLKIITPEGCLSPFHYRRSHLYTLNDTF